MWINQPQTDTNLNIEQSHNPSSNDNVQPNTSPRLLKWNQIRVIFIGTRRVN